MQSKRAFFLRENDSRIPSIAISPSRRAILPKLTIKEPSRVSPTKIMSIDRQITSGMVVDCKESKEGGESIKEITLKNGEEDNKTIFSYVIEKEIGTQYHLVTYRWTNRCKRTEESTYLRQEEHIYQGPILNNCKNGQGQYTIIRRYSDNSEKHQIVKGIWSNDMLQSGTVLDQYGEEKAITTGNRTKKSTKIIQPYMGENKTIRMAAMEIKKSSKLIPASQCKQSFSLIIHANDGNTYQSGLGSRQNRLRVPELLDS